MRTHRPVVVFENINRRQGLEHGKIDAFIKNPFIGGTVSAELNGSLECVEGANIRLLKDDRGIGEATSDNFGDFRFDGLDEGSGRYAVQVSTNGGSTQTIEVELGASINIGEIRLQRPAI